MENNTKEIIKGEAMKKIITVVFLFSILLFLPAYSFSQSGWFWVNSGITCGISSLYFVDESTGWAVGYGDTTILKIWKTTNGGTNWFYQIASIQTYEDIEDVYFININTGWTIGGQYGDTVSFVLKTTNGGSNWNRTILNSTTAYLDRRLFFVNQSYGFITNVTDGGVWRTSNGGLNWNIVFYDTTGFKIRAIHFVDSNTGWAAGDNNSSPYIYKIIKTINLGSNWTTQFAGPMPINSNRVNDIKFFNNSIGIVSGHTVLRTTNAGDNWSIVPNIHMRNISLNPSLKGWGIWGMDSVLKTNNGGQSWASYTVTSSGNTIFFVNDLTGWIGSSYGLYKTTNGGEPIGIKLISSEIPINYVLHQNYPNPFNPVTNIKFDIPKTTFVKLIIYDALGRDIATLVNENLKPGNYEVDWDASNYPSGVYFYNLITDGFSETKRMVLIK